MHAFPAPWALCGGWAVDAWLGRITREHGDVDVTVFAHDQLALVQHLPGWQFLAHHPTWAPGPGDTWWDGHVRLPRGTHIHARPPEFTGPMPPDGIANAEDGFTIEFYLDDRSGDDWSISRDPALSLPLSRAIAGCGWGLPAAAPEVLLFFKARTPNRRRDWVDFQALLPHLDKDQREWLRDAVIAIGHPWLNDLSRAPTESTP